MICHAIVVLGIEIPCDAPLFLTVLAFHIPCGLACVVAGIIAMLSTKRPGRHLTSGTLYYWCLVAVFTSASALAAMRWAEDYHLFILGMCSFAAASLGRRALQRRQRGWVRVHISSMGLSYILLLTAFYVDNGKSLPLWKELPSLAYWLLPSMIGLPLIVYAMFRHPLIRQANVSAQSIP